MGSCPEESNPCNWSHQSIMESFNHLHSYCTDKEINLTAILDNHLASMDSSKGKKRLQTLLTSLDLVLEIRILENIREKRLNFTARRVRE